MKSATLRLLQNNGSHIQASRPVCESRSGFRGEQLPSRSGNRAQRGAARRFKRFVAPLALVLSVTAVMLLASRDAMRSSASEEMVAVVPAGTRIHIRLETPVSSEDSLTGDPFDATLDSPLVVQGKLLVPKQARVVGQVTGVQPSTTRVTSPGVTMILNKIVVSGAEHSIETQPLTLLGAKSARVGQPASGRSAANRELVAYGPESRFSFTLQRPLELPVFHR